MPASALHDDGPVDIAAGSAARAAVRAGTHVTPLAHGATASWLNGDRLFLQHGPINLIARAGGPAPAVGDAYRALIGAFPDWLGALVEELPRLRSPESAGLALPAGPIARRMVAAVRACPGEFVTPMAAVAGAVADEATAVLAAQPGIEHAYVNNGGDIALHLEPGARLSVGVVPTLRGAVPRARIEIASDSVVRGVATSGWQGRSHSLGIADAVTVLAPSAALADAAATLIANAVDVDYPGIRREPARALDEPTQLTRREDARRSLAAGPAVDRAGAHAHARRLQLRRHLVQGAVGVAHVGPQPPGELTPPRPGIVSEVRIEVHSALNDIIS